MKIFRFDPDVGVPITDHQSYHVVNARVVRTTAPVQIGVMHLSAGGVLGYHRATLPQLFMVVAGDGWVRGESEGRESISVGQAAFWSAGEWHESGTDGGMSAVVVESESLDPGQYMHEA